MLHPQFLRIRCLDVQALFNIILLHLIIPLRVLFLLIPLILRIYSQISHLCLHFHSILILFLLLSWQLHTTSHSRRPPPGYFPFMPPPVVNNQNPQQQHQQKHFRSTNNNNNNHNNVNNTVPSTYNFYPFPTFFSSHSSSTPSTTSNYGADGMEYLDLMAPRR